MPAFDAESHPVSYGQNNSWTHTVGSSNNRIAIVVAACHNSSPAPSTVTFGGVAMTQLVNYEASYRRLGIYYLLNPAEGANTVVVNWGSSLGYPPGVSCVSFSDVNQVDPFDGESSLSGSTSPINKTISSNVDYLVMDAIAGISGGLACDVGQTQRYLKNTSGEIALGISTKAGAESVTTTWTKTGDIYWAMYSFSLVGASIVTISEGFTIHSSAQGGFVSEGAISEELSIHSEAKAGFSYDKGISEEMTIDDAAGSQLVGNPAISEGFTINSSGGSQIEFNGAPIVETMGMSSFAEAEYGKSFRRVKFPYKAQGRHLTIRFRNVHQGQWLCLLDMSATIKKLVGVTNSDKVQYRGQGSHLTVRFRHNVIDEALYLLYAAMTIVRKP